MLCLKCLHHGFGVLPSVLPVHANVANSLQHYYCFRPRLTSEAEKNLLTVWKGLLCGKEYRWSKNIILVYRVWKKNNSMAVLNKPWEFITDSSRYLNKTSVYRPAEGCFSIATDSSRYLNKPRVYRLQLKDVNHKLMFGL